MKRNIISFYELSEAWQSEALNNHHDDDYAKEVQYIEPLPEHVPETHILYDLSQAMYSHKFGSFVSSRRADK